MGCGTIRLDGLPPGCCRPSPDSHYYLPGPSKYSPVIRQGSVKVSWGSESLVGPAQARVGGGEYPVFPGTGDGQRRAGTRRRAAYANRDVVATVAKYPAITMSEIPAQK